MLGMNANPISDAIKSTNGAPTLARTLGLSPQAIYKWERAWGAGRVDAVPARRALEIERVTGIPRHRLRPDLWSAPDRDAA